MVRAALVANLLMSTESGTQTHSIVDNLPGESGLEGWKALVQQFDPASAHANLNLMSRILQADERQG